MKHPATKEEIRRYASGMRRKPTPYEAAFSERLSAAGIDHESQVRIGFYIADFLIRDRLLVIEIDGAQHSTGKGRAYDMRRDRFISDCGLSVIRVPNADVETWTLEQIQAYPSKPDGWASVAGRIGRRYQGATKRAGYFPSAKELAGVRGLLGLSADDPVAPWQIAEWRQMRNSEHKLRKTADRKGKAKKPKVKQESYREWQKRQRRAEANCASAR